MTFATHIRRLMLAVGVLILICFTVVIAIRSTLTGMAVDTVLRRAGASEIKFSVTNVSPWRIVVNDIGFLLDAQFFTAKRLTIARHHWWTPSLGAVKVEQVRLPLNFGNADAKTPVQVPPDKTPGSNSALHIPAEEISIDGQLSVQAFTLPEQVLMVKFEARQEAKDKWMGQMQLDGPGLVIKAEGNYDLMHQDLAFKVAELSLDLKQWQSLAQQLIPFPSGTTTIEGKITGNAEGRLQGSTLTAGGTVHLREGRYQNDQTSIAAEGVEADLTFVDFGKLHTKPGALRVSKMQAGQLKMSDLDAEVALEGLEKMNVTRASLKALGGKVSVEPFTFSPNLREIDAVLLVDGINVEEIMALTKDLPAKAKGRVNGRLPLRIDSNGMQIGTGWLSLTPGVDAEIQFNATGLLTGGMSPGSPSYAVLQKVESGLLNLKISELRLDIRPPGAPANRSAQLHLQGEPADPNVKAPVILDLNVNGPLEKLLNMGMDSRVNFGAGK